MNTSSWYDKEKKENNTKDTINGDKECFLVTESFVDPGPTEPGARGSLPQPQTFGRYVKNIHIREGEAVEYALLDFQTFLRL